MAGMPPTLIDRANEILKILEESRENKTEDSSNKNQGFSLDKAVKNLNIPQMQLSIFDAHSETFNEIRKLLTEIDINRLTPVEALMKLNEIKGKLK
jgi:DNA mismatch repair protein MutS